MKKLMIAAAIVCAAALSQAATCYWNTQTASGKYIYQKGSEYGDGFSGTALIFEAATYDQETIWNSIYDGSKTLADYTPVKEVSVVEGVIAKGTATSFTTDWTTGQNESFFLVVKDGDNYLFTETFKGKATDLTTGTDLKINAEYESGDLDMVHGNVVYAGEGGWYTASAVPEPTSGLLLLLGVAGLALRRRRA